MTRSGIAVTVVVIAMALIGCASDSGPVAGDASPVPGPGIRAEVRELVSRSGDADPVHIEAVRTTAGAANAATELAPGFGPSPSDPEQVVWLVQATGDFQTCPVSAVSGGCPVDGAQRTTYRYANWVVDATGTVRSQGYSHQPYDLSELGETVDLS